jgi:hypothetical protein
MADNVTLDPGTGGAVIATDDVSSVHYQLVQLVTGSDGGAKTLVTGSSGLPVSVLGTVPVSGTVAATQSGAWSVTVSGTPTVSVSGTVPVSIAAVVAVSDNASSLTVDDGGSTLSVDDGGFTLSVDDGGGTLTVDGSVSVTSVPSHDVTNAGTFAVQATQAGTWHVGDGGGTLTVDAPVGTPVFVRLSDGAAAISTLPVSVASVPSHDVTNAGTFAVQAAQSGAWTVAVSSVGGTVAVSAASLPLPTGAATAAKQPALGTAGTASADVITVQGIASMTALKVDGSAVTQPVSGTFWQATQPVSVATIPSHDVTNAGTFAVQAAQSGTWNINNVGTLATITNTVHVDDDGASLTVDAAELTAIAASTAAMDDWDETDRCKVNPIVGQAGVAAGAGAVAATVQRMTLASDDPAVASLAILDDWDSNDRAKVSPIAGQDGVQGGAGTVTALTQRVAFATDANAVDTELPAAAATADGASDPTAPAVDGRPSLYNGSTWDRERGNTDGTALSSAARTGTTSSADLVNYNCRGVIAFLDITANSGSGQLTVLIQGKDGTGNYYNLNGAGTAVAATNAKFGIEVYPGATTAGIATSLRILERTSAALPRTWRVTVSHSSGVSWTYSVTYSLIR